MNSPETISDAGLEVEPAKLPIRAVLFFKFLHALEKAQERRNRTQQLKDAGRYDEQAADADTSTSAALFLLSAGRAYSNAQRNDLALDRLEEARPQLEAYKMAGTLAGFTTLSSLYHTLEFSYRASGDEESAEEIHERSKTLAIEEERLFDIHTEFLEDGGRLISSVKRPPEIPREQVDY